MPGILLLSACQTQPAGDTGLPIRVGTIACEDTLPFWVAEQSGLFKDAGFSVEIKVFASSRALSAAVAANEVDLAVLDSLATVSLVASGTPLQLLWVALGTDAKQGHFSIVTNPSSGYRYLSDLLDAPIAVEQDTMGEYIVDCAVTAAEMSSEDFRIEPTVSTAVCYDLLSTGQVKAAVLPAPWVYYAERNGMTVVYDDAYGQNTSQTLMVASVDFIDSLDAELIAALQGVWNDAVDILNAAPDDYMTLLVQKSGLPPMIADGYQLSVYPQAERPEGWIISAASEWMTAEGLLKGAVNYSQQTGRLE
jgi:NitT/TauT family transport system substrate-binding protein